MMLTEYGTKIHENKLRAEGLAEGIEQTAMEMLRDHLSLETIKKYTKLSTERLTQLGKMHGLL